jgi:hypothetical protein
MLLEPAPNVNKQQLLRAHGQQLAHLALHVQLHPRLQQRQLKQSQLKLQHRLQ